MSVEADIIAESPAPLSQLALCEGLQQAGIKPGDVVLMHASMGSLGWVIGAQQTVLKAVLECLTPKGTLVMPGFSGSLTDPRDWSNPPVPEHWHQLIMDQVPLFDPHLTPTRGLGSVPEIFRAMPGVLRSHHPAHSFLALGPMAETITATQTLSLSLGPGSPLDRLYQSHAKVLFMGTGWSTATCFHRAEYDDPAAATETVSYPVSRKNNRTVWQDFSEIDFNEAAFPAIGADFEAKGAVRTALGGAIRVFSLTAAVDFARDWMLKKSIKEENLQSDR